MLIRNSAARYGIVSKLLHWSIAVVILGLVWLGWYMVDLGYFDRWYNTALALHKSFGLLVVMLAVCYFGWKRVSPSPQPVSELPRWQLLVALGMHAALMILMIAIPISGYLISTSAGKPVSFFGLFDVPAPASNMKSIRDFAIAAHFYCAYGIAALVVGHAGAAIKHQFVDRDGTLARMLWR